MVLTKKFSDFMDADLTDSSNELVGLSGGLNAKSQKVTEWTTVGRPTPPFNGLLGYNTDLNNWEYWDGSLLQWTQFQSVQGLGTAAFKDATDNLLSTVVSANGPFTIGHLLVAADTAGTAEDGGSPFGGGTVTQIDTGTGLTGGPITTSGTISFAAIAANSLWVNKTAGIAVPTVSALAALTKTDDTNITLILGGTPNTALINSVSLTLGWSGQLSLTRGGTNASLTASNGGIVYSTATALAILAGTATANLPLLSGSSTTPSWAPFSLNLGGALTTAGAFTMAGGFTFIGTLTGNTAVTFPTSGTLATTSGSVTTLTGDSGTATASAGNINVVGTGSGLTFTGSGATLTLGGTLDVDNGGTGAISLTGLLTGNGISAFTATAITQYNVLTGGASNAPNSVAPSATVGIPLISQGSSAQPVFGTAVVAGGGTGNTTFTAYSVICAGTTATGAFQNVSGLGTSGQVLTSNGAGALPTWQSNSATNGRLINIQYFTANGTYTPTAGTNTAIVKAWGAGGGGGGSGTSPGSAGTGGNTTFATTTVVAAGGSGGTGLFAGGAGGTAGSSTGDFVLAGGNGLSGGIAAVYSGTGGAAPFLGIETQGVGGSTTGGTGNNNSGAGGSGGGGISVNDGAGGGGGAFAQKIVTSITGTYAIVIGAGGTAGAAGTGGQNGGVGGTGLIIIEEYS